MTQARQTAGTQNGTGQKIGGQYKGAEHDRDIISLEDEAYEAAVESAIQRLTETIVDDGGYSESAARHRATEQIDEAVGEGMDPATAADIFILRGTIREARDYFPDVRALVEHEYSAAEIRDIYARFPAASGYDINKLLNAGIKPDRIAQLAELGAPATKTSAVLALADFDDAEVSDWVTALKENEQLAAAIGTWDTIGWIRARGQYGHQITPTEAAEYAAIGAKISNVVSVADTLTPATAKAFAEIAGRDINDCFHYFEHNQKHPDKTVTADQVKAYGPKLAPSEIFDLAQSEVDPKAARSLKAADGALSTPEITTLANAKITSGADYKRWRDLTAPIAGSRAGTGYASEANDFVRAQPDPMSRIVEAKMSGVNADHAAGYAARGVHRPALWKRLSDAGVTDLGPWVEGINSAGRRSGILLEDSRAHDGVQLSVAVISDFVRRGGTPERFGVLQRVGIPLDRMVDFIDSDDPWYDGQPFRERIAKAEVEREERYSSRVHVPEPWPYTADTYQQA